jgi:hypothetical protein
VFEFSFDSGFEMLSEKFKNVDVASKSSSGFALKN